MKNNSTYQQATELANLLGNVMGSKYPVFEEVAANRQLEYNTVDATTAPEATGLYVVQLVPMKASDNDGESPYPGAYVNVALQTHRLDRKNEPAIENLKSVVIDVLKALEVTKDAAAVIDEALCRDAGVIKAKADALAKLKRKA